MFRTFVLVTVAAACGGGAATQTTSAPKAPAARDYTGVADPEVDADCTKGSGVACFEMGARIADKLDPMAHGDEAKASAAKGIGYFTRGCDLKLGQACSAAAQMVAMTTMDLEAAFKLVEKGCPLGDTESCMQMGNSYRNGYATGGKNLAKAIQYYDMACKVDGYKRQKGACDSAKELREGATD